MCSTGTEAQKAIMTGGHWSHLATPLVRLETNIQSFPWCEEPRRVVGMEWVTHTIFTDNNLSSLYNWSEMEPHVRTADKWYIISDSRTCIKYKPSDQNPQCRHLTVPQRRGGKTFSLKWPNVSSYLRSFLPMTFPGGEYSQITYVPIFPHWTDAHPILVDPFQTTCVKCPAPG